MILSITRIVKSNYPTEMWITFWLNYDIKSCMFINVVLKWNPFFFSADISFIYSYLTIFSKHENNESRSSVFTQLFYFQECSQCLCLLWLQYAYQTEVINKVKGSPEQCSTHSVIEQPVQDTPSHYRKGTQHSGNYFLYCTRLVWQSHITTAASGSACSLVYMRGLVYIQGWSHRWKL